MWHLYNRCIPYRQDKTKDENRIEVLMVSSPNRDDMVFPKVLIFLIIFHICNILSEPITKAN